MNFVFIFKKSRGHEKQNQKKFAATPELFNLTSFKKQR